MCAAMGNQLEIARWLLNQGADIKARNGKKKAAHEIAAEWRAFGTAEFLRQAYDQKIKEEGSEGGEIRVVQWPQNRRAQLQFQGSLSM